MYIISHTFKRYNGRVFLILCQNHTYHKEIRVIYCRQADSSRYPIDELCFQSRQNLLHKKALHGAAP